jgi:hypothetical protein
MTSLEKLKAEMDDLYEKAEAADKAVVLAQRDHRHYLNLAYYARRLYEIELGIVEEKAGK